MRRLLPLLLTAVMGLGAAPNAREIIRLSVAANEADWQALPEYSHRETDTQWKVDSNGKTRQKSSRTYELRMIDGSPYEKLIALNGRPLSLQEQRKEEMKLEREIAARQRESESQRASRVAKYKSARQSDHLLMTEMIHAFDFKLAGEDQLNGRPVYVLDATPRPGYRPPNQKTKALTGMKGRLWVDKQHYHWVKVEAEITKPVTFDYFVAKVGPGTRFEFEQAPVGGNVWLPSRFAQTVNATIFGIVSHHTGAEETYTGYRPANSTLVSRR